MKPLNFIALILFLTGVAWALTRSEPVVREIQVAYFKAIAPTLQAGSALETKARELLEETKHSKALETELQAIRSEIGRLRIIESRFNDLERENNSLRHALDFKEATNFDVVAAQIIRRHPTTWWQTLEIDAGEDQGIGIQLSVLSNDGLVGLIDRPFKNRSSVLLVSDEKCQVSVRVEGSPEVGILSGQRGKFDNNPTLRLRFLSKDAALRPGQRVFTTGRGGIFQPNILVGTIISVEKGPLDSEALVAPAVNLSDLGTVFVVLSETN
ncbi:MAG: rod shape-determining protein MreC [Akkermansiaceae bacterium]